MVKINIKKGLDLPIKGKPEGQPKPLVISGTGGQVTAPRYLGLDFHAFSEVKFKLLVHVGDNVKRGEPLAEDKDYSGRVFVSPAGGVIKEIRRGLKRALLDIIIEVAQDEQVLTHPLLDVHHASQQEIIDYMMSGGVFSRIHQRPFGSLANVLKVPKAIFVKALESAPFIPPAEMQVAGYEKEFQVGLDILRKLTEGKVHLVYREGTPCEAFSQAKGVEKHTAQGPHPIANHSVHIQSIDPIRHPEEVVWTLDTHTTVLIGFLILHGQYFVNRVVSIAGPGVLDGKTGYFRVREGYPISDLASGRMKKGAMRLISGDVFMGRKVEMEDYLGYDDDSLCILPENTQRELLHFFRLGLDKYTFSKTYLSGHLNNTEKNYDFTTNQHGEPRFFIDSTLYDEVMPLEISTVHLVRAVMSEDYDLAADLGLLEVDPEDFALPTFVCPSKIEMTDIIRNGLSRYAKEILK